MSKQIKTWQERVIAGYEECDEREARDAEIAELRAALATPAVAIGALPELPEHGEMGSMVTKGKVHPKYSADQMRAYGQACAADAAPNAALVEALEALIEVAEQCDSWESFPGNALAQARAALAQAGEAAK